MPYDPLNFDEDYAPSTPSPSAPSLPATPNGPVSNPTPVGITPATPGSSTGPASDVVVDGGGGFTQTGPGAGDPDTPPTSPNYTPPNTAPVTTPVTVTPTEEGGKKKKKAAAPAPITPNTGGAGGTKEIVFPDAEFDGRIKGFIDDLLAGKISQYDPNTMDYIRTDLIRNRERAKETAKDTVYADAARRGMFRSGQTSSRIDSAMREADSTYSRDWTQVLMDKARSDVQMKMAGLERAQDWLNSRRQFILGKESNDTQRRLGEAQIALGYARIEAEKEMTQMQLSRMGGGSSERSFTITNADGTTTDIPEWLMELILRSES